MTRSLTVAICSSRCAFPPAAHTAWAERVGGLLRERGHRVDTIFVPRPDGGDADDAVLTALRWRMVDVSRAGRSRVDLAICGDPFSAYVQHPSRVLWLERAPGEDGSGDPPLRGAAEERLFGGAVRRSKLVVVGSDLQRETLCDAYALSRKHVRTAAEYLAAGG